MTSHSSFRRAFVENGCVCVETGPGRAYYMPNPTLDGRRYDPRRILAAVVAAGRVDVEKWRKMDDPGDSI